MLPTTTRSPPTADDGYPTDQELHSMTNDGGPLDPQSARQTAADRSTRRDAVLARRTAGHPDRPAPAPSSSLTLADLVRLEADLVRDVDRGLIPGDAPATPTVAAALRLAAGGTNEHAIGVVRTDILAIVDAVRGSYVADRRPRPGDYLHVSQSGR